MKKKILISVTVPLAVLILAALLFVPIPGSSRDDGGTREYKALAYKVVKWNRIYPHGIYRETGVYWGLDAHKTLDELWLKEVKDLTSENQNTAIPDGPSDTSTDVSTDSVSGASGEEYTFLAESWGILNNEARFRIVAGEAEGPRSCSRVTIAPEKLPLEPEKGKYYEISCVMELRPFAEMTEIRSMEPVEYPFRNREMKDVWVIKSDANRRESFDFPELFIAEIYADCFFAEVVTTGVMLYRINGTLSEEWKVGDQIAVTCKNIYSEKTRDGTLVEGDLVTIVPASKDSPITYDKPVIYLYPEEETRVSVKVNLDGKLTCVYPAYNDGWCVTASPDGTLTDAQGQTYNYLYWEGDSYGALDLSRGFCVAGKDTASFLEDALAKLGLTRREANEFIVYWLPLMQKNRYNVISFQSEAYTDAAVLEIDPAPDTLIRVFMAFEGVDEPVEIPPQTLTAPARNGFTVVEWGGSEISKSE